MRNIIKVEPIKTRVEFKEFVRAHNFEFAGMSVGGCPKMNIRWFVCISDENLTERVIEALESIDCDYIIYSGEIYGRFYAAAEIKS